jgi:hypothetical protein
MSDPAFPGNDGYPGFKSLFGGLDSFNAIVFTIQQILAGVATSMLVQVKSVTPGSGLLPGVVSVQPMVNQVGGDGNPVPHGTIYNIPFMRLQGGTSAIIMDPVVNDIGLAVFASRDISSVKANKAVSNPGSRRRFDMADGLYFGGFLNGAPTEYVQMLNGGGINIVTPATLTFQASNATLDADGNLAVIGDVTAGDGGADSVTLQNHTHGNVQNGGDHTDPPDAGT